VADIQRLIRRRSHRQVENRAPLRPLSASASVSVAIRMGRKKCGGAEDSVENKKHT
jgi:hypothetical protein